MTPATSAPASHPVARAAAFALLAGLVVLLPLLHPAAASSGASEQVKLVVLDVTRVYDPGTLRTDTTCGATTTLFQVDDRGLHFIERDPSPQPVPGFYPGYGGQGCGDAILEVDVPAGTDHMHIRFSMDREVRLFNVGGLNVDAGIHFLQQVRTTTDGNTSAPQDVYAERDASTPTRLHELEALRPEGDRKLQLAWHFQDIGCDAGTASCSAPNGAAYRATLSNITIEFSGVPARAPTVTSDEERSGTLVTTSVQVAVQVDAAEVANETDLRFRFDPSLAFGRVIAPDAQVLEDRGTRIAAGANGFDRSRPLLERGSDYVQLTLASDLLKRHGAGTYTLVMTQQRTLPSVPALIPLDVVLLLSPAPFALLAFWRILGFEREAFGGFRRSAIYLRIALVAAFLYYLVVVIDAFQGDRLLLMTTFPTPLEGILLYVQVGVAIAAFVALYLVARELYQITQPKEPVPRDAP